MRGKVTTIEMCGCEIRTIFHHDGEFEAALDPCSLHAAAPQLLEAVKAARNWYGLDGDGITVPVLDQLDAAIAAARGDKLDGR